MKYCLFCLCMGIVLLVAAGCKQTESVAAAEATCDEVWDGPTMPDEPPRLIGGLADLQRRLQYPDMEREHGIEGQVTVQYVVNKQGRPIDLEVTKSMSFAFDQEAVRAVRRSRFRPARHEGSPVCMKMSIPLTFRLMR